MSLENFKELKRIFRYEIKLKIPLETAFNFYEDLKINLKIFSPGERSLSIFENLIQKYNPKGNQVFDIEIVSIMFANNISKIATINKKDFINITEVQIIDLPDT